MTAAQGSAARDERPPLWMVHMFEEFAARLRAATPAPSRDTEKEADRG